MGREEGGGFMIGNTCKPVAHSFWYLAKLIQFVKFKNKIKFKKNNSIAVFKIPENHSIQFLVCDSFKNHIHACKSLSTK